MNTDQWLVNKEDLPEGIVEFHEMICGCRQPQICWDILLVYLLVTGSYYSTEEPFELFFIYVIDHLKFTEHGTSIYGAWITNKGKEVLAWLQQNIDKAGDLVVCY